MQGTLQETEQQECESWDMGRRGAKCSPRSTATIADGISQQPWVLAHDQPANNQSWMERGPWALPLPDGLSPSGGFWRRNSLLFQVWTHCQTYRIPGFEHFQTHDTQMSLFKISESQKNTNRHQCGKWNYRVEGDGRKGESENRGCGERDQNASVRLL